MKSILEILEQRISAVMSEAAGQTLRQGSERAGCPAMVKQATDSKFGDYQVNGVMSLAKQLKTNPRKLAEQIVSQLNISYMCEAPEIAGPGFINLRLKPEFVSANLLQINSVAEGLGIEKTETPKTIVVDFSGPNIAKQMHVGHLRSTIIGDCICRILEFQGHKVIRQNHIGDWGTQFGMLCAYFDRKYFGPVLAENKEHKDFETLNDKLDIADTEQFYREAKQLFDTDPEFAKTSRKYVVLLQSRDEHVMATWEHIVHESLLHCEQLYRQLGVKLKIRDVRGESAYNSDLKRVVEILKKKKIAVESEGAVCVFPPGFKDKEGKPLPVIVQKSDGAYLYATTDLAAIRYRVDKLKASKIIYVTDSRQGLHFEMVFAVARMAEWVKPETDLVHVMFGSVLGEDGKPLKTRSGENVKLKELLDEAVERARKVVEEKNPGLSEDEKKKIAKAVGIGAVKYADYSNNRTSDYIFSFDKMLAMDGNTAPYMQYAYARIRSIERKAGEKNVDIERELAGINTLSITEPSEMELAKHLIRYGEAVTSAAGDYRPNYLTAYLYDLAQKFSSFYTNCPVLDAPPDKRPTRLLLCDLTAKTIEHGLHNLLGIEVIEQM